MVWADASQPCPPLEIKASCSPQGTAAIQLRARTDSPPGLRYLVSLPDEDIGAISLAPNASLTFDLPDPKARQLTVAVVGLEPAGASLAACCMSNQRVHLPASCAPINTDADAGPDAGTRPDDLALVLTLSPKCARQRATPICEGTIAITGAGDSPAQVTLSADLAESIVAVGADCSGFAQGHAICRLPIGRVLPFDLALTPTTPRTKATLCAEIGIGADQTAHTLALQDALAKAGYSVGAIDGDFGPATLAALTEFVADAGLPPLTADIPPEVLFLLGITEHSDGMPTNDRACATTSVPSPPLICDVKSTKAAGDACTCRFTGMIRVSASSCVCKKGTKLGANGCEAVKKVTPSPADTTLNDTDTAGDTAPVCDPATTVLRGGICECRLAAMTRLSATTCQVPELRFCPDGRPEVPGFPCAPEGPACARVNEAGECCDDLGPEDASCR